MADYLSASQINRFLSEPALWFVEQLYGVRGQAGAGAWRGSACEAAMDAVLFQDATDTAALDAAMSRFEVDAQGDLADDVTKERDAIPRYLANLLPIARAIKTEKGMPLLRQAKIELDLPDIRLPVIGYVDYLWEDMGMDLKTVGRAPSFDDAGKLKDKNEHIRQVSIYAQAKGRPFSLLYAFPTKGKPAVAYPVSDDECAAGMRQVMAAARAIDRLITSGRDRDALAIMYPPRDLSSYLWSAETRAKAIEIWKL